MKQCVYGALVEVCQNSTLSGDDDPLRVAEPRRITGPVRDAIEAVLGRIHALAPHAKIVLMGYPRLLEGDGGCATGIGSEEAPWLNQMADLLDQEMNGAAADATAAGAPTGFSDPRDFFTGRAVCGSPEDIHGIVIDHTKGDPTANLHSAQSFHPKVAGAADYARSLNSTLLTMGM